MPHHRPQPTHATAAPAGSTQVADAAPALRVLLCGRFAAVSDRLGSAGGLSVVTAGNADHARELLAEAAPDRRIDLALLDAALPGAEGLALAEEFASAGRRPGYVLLADPRHPVTAAGAGRAGLLEVLDTLPAPEAVADALAPAVEAARRVVARERAARVEQRQSRELARRFAALERRCATIEEERRAVSDQVESLCGDLVQAYQELSDRLDAASPDAWTPSGAFEKPNSTLPDRLSDELDLEGAIRATLEHLVREAGGTNAAVFLPASLDEYSLGGYVNHTCTPESAGMLLEHLADVVAPKLSGAAGPVHLTDDEQLEAWFGDDAAWLDDCELVGVPCVLGASAGDDEDECLAVVVLFREADQPYGAAALEACEAVGPVLAETLHRIVRVHHRTGFAQDEGETEPSF